MDLIWLSHASPFTTRPGIRTVFAPCVTGGTLKPRRESNARKRSRISVSAAVGRSGRGAAFCPHTEHSPMPTEKLASLLPQHRRRLSSALVLVQIMHELTDAPIDGPICATLQIKRRHRQNLDLIKIVNVMYAQTSCWWNL